MALTRPAQQAATPKAEGGACRKHLVTPFDGALTLRGAYRTSKPGAFQFCPQWSSFGTGRGRAHGGIDISAPTGTPVRAATDGVLTYGRDPGGYGLYARLRYSTPVRDKDGACSRVEEHEIVYAHMLDDKPIANAGPMSVHAGAIVGHVGCTGNAKGMCSPSPESHLHVTVQRAHGQRERLDPTEVLGWNISMPREADRPAEWGTCSRPSGRPAGRTAQTKRPPTRRR